MARNLLAVALFLALVTSQATPVVAEVSVGGRDTPFSLFPGVYVIDLRSNEVHRVVSTDGADVFWQGYQSLAWAPDGGRLAVVPSIGKGVQVYDAATGKLQRDIAGYVYSIDWPSGDTIGANMRRGSLPDGDEGRGLVNATTGNLDAFTPGSFNPGSVSPDGRYVAYPRAAGERGLYVRDTNGGEERMVLAGEANGTTWSPDSTRIATTLSEVGTSSLVLVHVGTSEELLRLPSGATSVAWSPNGDWFAANFYQVGTDSREPMKAVLYAGDGSRSRHLGPGTPVAWSPDSQLLALLRDGELWLYSIADGSTTPLLRPQMPVIRETHWSPDGRFIAFRTGGGSLATHISRPDGTDDHYLAPGSGAKWSPKGDRIGLIYGDGGLGFSGAVYTMTPQGTAINRLTHVFYGDVPLACAFGGGFTWSPDGSSLAVWSQGTQSRLNLSITDDTATPQPRDFAVGIWAEWSPDGQRLAFTEPGSPPASMPGAYFLACRVSVADPDGGNRLVLTEGARAPRWSPDGSLVAVESLRGAYGFGENVGVVPSNGGPPRAEFRGRSPAWSPDGERIGFLRPAGPTGAVPSPHAPIQLVVSSPDGSNERVLATESIRNFDWSPNGKRVAYDVANQVESSIYVVELDGGATKRILSGWSPAWSPDGRWIAYNR